MKRFIIAGTNSGCGKTTITCAVLSALRKRGMKTASFKCGPDYIDPMFHRHIIDTESHNLDSFFCDGNTLCHLLYEYGKNSDISVIEGVMGFYDGNEGSAYSVSEITETNVIMVIDCKGMSDSIGAVMQGFLSYREPNKISGFIFNRLPKKLEPLAERLCSDMNVEYFGSFPQSKITFQSRRLGLVTADEIDDIKEKINKLGELAEENILIDKILSLRENAVPEFTSLKIRKCVNLPVIAVARDSAFCFIYEENIDLLKKMGCELRYFSPLKDREAPEADGIILCGGYPELYLKELSENTAMLSDIKQKINSGMPVIAECGGFMYLHDIIENEQGEKFSMVGAIHGKVFPTGRLQRFGYMTMTANDDNMLCRHGDKVKAHEFHYWDSTNCGYGFSAVKKDGKTHSCVHANSHMYAGFPHIYFYSDTGIAERFVQICGGKYEQDKTDRTF